MKNVYIVADPQPYEGTTVLGVFDNEADAQKCANVWSSRWDMAIVTCVQMNSSKETHREIFDRINYRNDG